MVVSLLIRFPSCLRIPKQVAERRSEVAEGFYRVFSVVTTRKHGATRKGVGLGHAVASAVLRSTWFN